MAGTSDRCPLTRGVCLREVSTYGRCPLVGVRLWLMKRPQAATKGAPWLWCVTGHSTFFPNPLPIYGRNLPTDFLWPVASRLFFQWTVESFDETAPQESVDFLNWPIGINWYLENAHRNHWFPKTDPWEWINIPKKPDRNRLKSPRGRNLAGIGWIKNGPSPHTRLARARFRFLCFWLMPSPSSSSRILASGSRNLKKNQTLNQMCYCSIGIMPHHVFHSSLFTKRFGTD